MKGASGQKRAWIWWSCLDDVIELLRSRGVHLALNPRAEDVVEHVNPLVPHKSVKSGFPSRMIDSYLQKLVSAERICTIVIYI